MKMLMAAVLSLSVVGCCAVPQKAVQQIEATHDIVLPKYLRYVEQDAALNADQKDDQKKLVESLQRLVDALKEEVD